jgi:hypothetical protein
MQRIGHIDAFPPVGLDREVDNVSGLRVDFHGLQDWERGTPIHSAIYDQPSSHCTIVIWLRDG